MTDANTILAAARARLGAAWPEARDVTGRAHSTEDAGLPAFAVRIEPGSSEPAGMGEPASWLRDTDLIVEIMIAPPPADPEATLQDFGQWAQLVILAHQSDFGSGLLRCDPGEIVTEHAAGKRQTGRVEATMTLQFEEEQTAPILRPL